MNIAEIITNTTIKHSIITFYPFDNPNNDSVFRFPGSKRIGNLHFCQAFKDSFEVVLSPGVSHCFTKEIGATTSYLLTSAIDR
ncbi:MAG: hypothetical protein DHS20C17_13010 [Cyclobacteriaceae bacterium]|nr:MAG: hypothetical protein DHS20C17_13010 [Cyclobacteriaceae bacterium]